MKKATRAVSMLLVCVMSMLIFTGCVTSGNVTYWNDKDYVVSRGCNSSVTYNSSLQKLAVTTMRLLDLNLTTYISDETIDKELSNAVNEAYTELHRTTGATYIFGYIEVEISSNDKRIVYFDSNGLYRVRDYYNSQTVVRGYLSNMKYYGVDNEILSNYESYGNVIVAYFAK